MSEKLQQRNFHNYQQTAQCSSLDIYIILSPSVFLHNSVRKRSSSSSSRYKYQVTLHKNELLVSHTWQWVSVPFPSDFLRSLGSLLWILINCCNIFLRVNEPFLLFCEAGGNPPNALLIVFNPVFVPPFISRGAPRRKAWETSISERRNCGR
jgi:hypothetical protein